MRAGVQTGDRIIKVTFLSFFHVLFFLSLLSSVVAGCFQVNGTLVTRSNHMEVVKLIKCKFKRWVLDVDGRAGRVVQETKLAKNPA